MVGPETGAAIFILYMINRNKVPACFPEHAAREITGVCVVVCIACTIQVAVRGGICFSAGCIGLLVAGDVSIDQRILNRETAARYRYVCIAGYIVIGILIIGVGPVEHSIRIFDLYFRNQPLAVQFAIIFHFDRTALGIGF